MNNTVTNEDADLFEVLKAPDRKYRQTYYAPGNIELFDRLKQLYIQKNVPEQLLVSERYDYHGWLSGLVQVIKTIVPIQDVNKANPFSDIQNKVLNTSAFKDPIYQDALHFLYSENRLVNSLEMPIVTYVTHSSEGKIRNLTVQLLNAGSGKLFPAKEMAFIKVEKDWQDAFGLAFEEIKTRYPKLEQYDISWYISKRLAAGEQDNNASLPVSFANKSASATFAFALETLVNTI